MAHQADRLHETGEQIDIERETVETYLNDIEKIVNAIYNEIQRVNNS
ncbi:MAG: hypothetical protein HFG81_01340 [Dorea sp.]|nr:hypothetical protein [Dorea sp.]